MQHVKHGSRNVSAAKISNTQRKSILLFVKAFLKISGTLKPLIQIKDIFYRFINFYIHRNIGYTIQQDVTVT